MFAEENSTFRTFSAAAAITKTLLLASVRRARFFIALNANANGLHLHVTNKIYCRICSRRYSHWHSTAAATMNTGYGNRCQQFRNLQDFVIRSHWDDTTRKNKSEMTDIFYIYLKSEVSILFQLGSAVDIVDAQMHSIKMEIRVTQSHTHVVQMMIDSQKMSNKFYLPLNGHWK